MTWLPTGRAPRERRDRSCVRGWPSRAGPLWTPWYCGVHVVVVLLLVRQNEVMLVRCDEIERPLNDLLVVGLGEVVNPPIPEDQID